MSPNQTAGNEIRLLIVPLIKCKPPTTEVQLCKTKSVEARPWSIPTADVLGNGIIDISRSAQYTDCCREVGCRNTSDKSKTLHRFNTLPRTSQGHTNRGVWNDSLSTEQLATMYRREPPPLFTTHPQASLTEHTLPTSHNSGDCCLSKQINLMRDPVLVRHCNHWPLGDQITCGQISVRGSTVDKGVRQEAVHSSETTDRMAQTVENLVDHQTSATAEVLETRLQQLYERRKRMLSQLSDEERKLHRLLCEEMVLTGIGPQSNTHLARGINAGAGDTLSDGSAHSTKTTSDAVRSSCLISKLKWRNSRRSKSAHERVEDGNTVHRALDTQDTRVSHDPVHRHVTLSDGSPSLMGPQLGHEGWRENGMSTPRRAFNWWRPNRRRAAVIDAKRRQSTTGYPADSVADKRESQSLRIRGSSLPPGDQARRPLPIDNDVKSQRLNARVPESSWPGVRTLGGAVWTNLHTLDTTLNIRRDDPRGYQRCFRQVPPVSWSNIQATQTHYIVPNSLTCCGGDCSWVQSAPQNAVIGNAYAGMVSTGTIKTSHQKSDFGNRLHQQLPLSGTQTATARWKAMQCEPTTNLCNPLRSDSYQPPIPTKVREWALQKNVNNNGRIIDLRFADVHRYQEEIQPNILAQLRMVKADTGQNGAKTSNKTYHVTNHNKLLFDAALHSVKPSRGILISPSRSNLAGTDVSQNVKTSSSSAQHLPKTRLVYEPFIPCVGLPARAKHSQEQLAPETWPALHPSRSSFQPSTRETTRAGGGKLRTHAWPSRYDGAIWYHVPCSRPERRSQQTDGIVSTEQSRWVTIPHHPHGTIISNGQCAQSPLKGSADVNGYGDDAMKYFHVRLDQHKPM